SHAPQASVVSRAGGPVVDAGAHAAERMGAAEFDGDRLDFVATGDAAGWPIRVGVDEALRVWREEGVVPGHALQDGAVLEQPQEPVRSPGKAVAVDRAAALEDLADRKPGGAGVLGRIFARVTVDHGGVGVELDGELFGRRLIAGCGQDSAADGVVERLGAKCAGAGVTGA